MSEQTPPRPSPESQGRKDASQQEQLSTAAGGQNEPASTERPAKWWTTISTPARSKPAGARWALLRLVWAALVGLVLVLTWSSAPGVWDWQDEVANAQSLADLNNDSAEGAPQQAVVNGWHAADLAAIQIRQTSESLERQAQQSNMILVLGLGVFGDLALRALRDRQRTRDQNP